MIQLIRQCIGLTLTVWNIIYAGFLDMLLGLFIQGFEAEIAISEHRLTIPKDVFYMLVF